MGVTTNVDNECILLRLTDTFNTYKPVGYILKGGITLKNSSWGDLFASLIRHYMYKDIVAFKTAISDGVFKRTEGIDVEEVVQSKGRGLKGATNLGHGVYVATKGLKGEDVAYYLNSLVTNLGVDMDELYILVSKKSSNFTIDSVKESIERSKQNSDSAKLDRGLKSTVPYTKVNDVEVVGAKDVIKSEDKDDFKVDDTVNSLYIDFDDSVVATMRIKKGVISVEVESKVGDEALISLDLGSDWCDYIPLSYSFRGNNFIEVPDWRTAYVSILSGFTVSTKDSDRFQAIIDKGVFICYDHSLISNVISKQMLKPVKIGRGIYVDDCYFNPNDMKTTLLTLFTELNEDLKSLKFRVTKIGK